jgi:hypothetical protein
MNMAYEEQINNKKNVSHEGYMILHEDKKAWRKLVAAIVSVDPGYLTKDELMDFMHFITRAVQLKIKFRFLSD